MNSLFVFIAAACLLAATAASGQSGPCTGGYYPDGNGCCPIILNGNPYYRDGMGCYPANINGMAYSADGSGCYPNSAGQYPTAGQSCPVTQQCHPMCIAAGSTTSASPAAPSATSPSAASPPAASTASSPAAASPSTVVVASSAPSPAASTASSPAASPSSSSSNLCQGLTISQAVESQYVVNGTTYTQYRITVTNNGATASSSTTSPSFFIVADNKSLDITMSYNLVIYASTVPGQVLVSLPYNNAEGANGATVIQPGQSYTSAGYTIAGDTTHLSCTAPNNNSTSSSPAASPATSTASSPAASTASSPAAASPSTVVVASSAPTPAAASPTPNVTPATGGCSIRVTVTPRANTASQTGSFNDNNGFNQIFDVNITNTGSSPVTNFAIDFKFADSSVYISQYFTLKQVSNLDYTFDNQFGPLQVGATQQAGVFGATHTTGATSIAAPTVTTSNITC